MKRRDVPRLLKNAAAEMRINSSEKGVVLLHGFTGTPSEMKFLGQRIFERGFSISIPRYPGHGTKLEEMVRSSARDWYVSAREAYIELKDYCSEVFIVGLSMGGILGIKLAREFPVKKLALLSVPAFIKEKSIYLTPIIGIFKKILWRTDPTKGVRCEEARSHHVCYNTGIPIRQSWQLLRMLKGAMWHLGEVRSDVLLIQSRNDSVIPQHSIDYLFKRLGSEKKEKVLLERSDHTITIDFEKEQVADTIITFLGG